MPRTRLERAGLLAVERPGDDPDRSDRKVYALTPSGQQRVAEWIAEVGWPRPDLAEFHLKLFAAAAAGLADPLTLVDTQRRFRRSGSCSPWCWQPCSGWRRSPLFPPASAAAAR